MRNPNTDVRRCLTCCGFHGSNHECPDGGTWPPNVTQLRPSAPRSLPDPPERPDARAVVAFLVFAVLVGAVVGTAGAAWFTRRSR